MKFSQKFYDKNHKSSRWCSLCKLHKPVDGGEWITFNRGKNRKWICSKHKKEESKCNTSTSR